MTMLVVETIHAAKDTIIQTYLEKKKLQNDVTKLAFKLILFQICGPLDQQEECRCTKQMR